MGQVWYDDCTAQSRLAILQITEMAVADVEPSIESTIATVLNKLDGMFFSERTNNCT